MWSKCGAGVQTPINQPAEVVIGIDQQHTQPPVVVLIHGLHQGTASMRILAYRLRQHGYVCHLFAYPSRRCHLVTHSQHLQRWLLQRHCPSQPLYMLGHSLGGLLIRMFLTQFTQWHVPRCLTLGTPHLGSVSADWVATYAPWLLGQAYHHGLDGDVPPLPNDTALGVIAGTRQLGTRAPLLTSAAVLRLLTRTPLASRCRHANNLRVDLSGLRHQANDGTVLVSETQSPQAVAHLSLPVSHTGMLLQTAVAEHSAYFLRHGRFDQ